MNILKLVAQLALDGRNFKAGIKEAQSAVNSFGRDMAGALKGEIAGVFGGAALVAFVKSSLSAVANLKDLAEQSSITTSEVQQLEFAAQGVGLAVEDITTAISRLGAARKSAAEGSEADRDQFRKFGITLKELQNPALRNIDLFKLMAKELESMPRTAATDEMLRDFLGKAGPKMVETMKELSSLKFNPVPEENVKRISDAENKLKSLATVARGVAAMVVTDFAKSFKEIFTEGKVQNILSPVLIFKGWEDALKTAFGDSPPATPKPEAVNFTEEQIESQRRLTEAIKDNEEQVKALEEEHANLVKAGADDTMRNAIIDRINLLHKERGELSALLEKAKEVAKAPDLYKDAAKEARQKAIDAANANLQEQVLKFRLAGMTPSQQRKEKENSVRGQMGLVQWMEDFDFPEEQVAKEKARLAQMATELREKPTRLDVNSLTAQGQLLGGGSSVVADGTTKLIQAVEKLISPQKETANATKELNRKITGVVTIVGAE